MIHGLLVFCAIAVSRLAEIRGDVISCGGFVKADYAIQFSKIMVKLYTPEGNLKYETDCAPNNGYYMIPIYNTGEYEIRIVPPEGWAAEPAVRPVSIDGETDPCSTGKDINFSFKGFSVSGQVVSSGLSTGPRGLPIALIGKNGEKVNRIETAEGGSYAFPAVSPDDYVIEVDSSSKCWGKKRISVKVADDKVIVNEDLVVSGYSVKGSIVNQKEPVPGVEFLLLGKPTKAHPAAKPNAEVEPIIRQNYPGQSLLFTKTSDSRGVFEFDCVQPGKYGLLPFFRKHGVTFDVQPGQKDITVAHEDLAVEPKFEVKGFTVVGHAYISPPSEKQPGLPLSGAKVFLNGKETATTNDKGSYALPHVTSGTYTVTLEKEGMKFDPLKIQISPNSPKIPNISPVEFQVCGVVVINQWPQGVAPMKSRRVLITSVADPKDSRSVPTNDRGEFCDFVKRGNFVIEPQILPAERRAGLVLQPERIDLPVPRSDTDKIAFRQIQSSVSGVVKCLGDCVEPLTISIVSDEGHHVKETAVESSGRFLISDVLPGKYKLKLQSVESCWEEESMNVEVAKGDLADVSFVQTGFVFEVESKHVHDLHYKQLDSEPKNVGTLKLKKGTQRFCLKQKGEYTFTPRSCHQFPLPSFTVQIPSIGEVALLPERHKVSFAVELPANEPMDVKVDVSYADSEQKEDFSGPILQKAASNTTKTDRYVVSLFALPQRTLNIVVSSKTFLFFPDRITLEVQDDCLLDAATFSGEKGLYLRGNVNPPLQDVAISVSSVEENGFQFDVLTGRDGSYRVGPLRSLSNLVISAEKHGYIITQEPNSANFEAKKLSELIIKAIHKDKPLEGVLVSLSGGSANFRSNNLTTETGQLVYVGLSPGQYFVRPILKEFDFAPPTQMIDLAEGLAQEVVLVATKVAFSWYGVVRTLNGQPVSGVNVIAISSKCESLQEEAFTSKDGSYRLTGLKPGCPYNIELRSDGRLLPAIPRTPLAEVKDDDVQGQDIVTVQDMSGVDLAANLDIDRPELLSMFKVVLVPASEPENPIAEKAFDTSRITYLPSITQDGRTYVARLELTNPSASSLKGFHVGPLPEVTFKADSSFKLLKFKFSPKPKKLDPELSKASYVLFPLAILYFVLSQYKDDIIPVMRGLFETLTTTIANQSASRHTSKHSGVTRDFDEVAAGLDIASNAKKKQKARKT